jgi:hypothetical protein
VVRRLSLASFAGIAFALALLFGAGAFSPDEARALDPATAPKYFDPVTRKEADIFKKIIEASYGDDSTRRQAARNVLRRSLQTSAPRMVGTVAGKGGLVGAAVGVWAVVGLEVVFLPCWECSSQTIPTGVDVAPAQGSILTYDTTGHSSTGTQTTVGVVSHVEWVVRNDGKAEAGCTVSAYVKNWEEVTNRYGTFYYSGQVGCRVGFVGPLLTADSSPSDVTLKPRPLLDVSGTTQGVVSAVPPYDQVESRVRGSWESVRTLPLSPGDHSYRVPTWDVGEVREGVPSPSTPVITMTPSEGTRFVNTVVADPQAPEVVPDEDIPLYEPDPDWDPNTDPFSPCSTRSRTRGATPTATASPTAPTTIPRATVTPTGTATPTSILG